VNDWARELYKESGGRFILLLPLRCMSAEEATAELLRVAEFGLPTGVIFDWVGAPEPVMHQMWEPVWAAAAETGMPGQPAREPERRYTADRGRRHQRNPVQSSSDARCQLPDGNDG
jgi:hypothetical protein